MSKHKTQKGKKEKYLCPFRALFLLFIVVLEENPGISKIFCSHSTTTKSLGLDTGCSWGHLHCSRFVVGAERANYI